ncbi:hypothetical protein SELMODRAFT_162334 [Selaginella moellendorffii]|uniref:ABC1 atypical kinase-like domain-containing protein n=1 Tax=Selaginella moellendorffii TaxID=88036 RepID=D8TA37_SELML|nr:uncharacterized aarF domain-containing protein kinase 1 isoform X1 [Selaginella moellendorffii]EFJ06435.1 hypothetical protein SELMODRAFT_162334 [Selaginella moellendorffii]|eukprot:XP_002992497.1 uncharacterized aarF domain-containing protein kinase 1 isoform X1 [Selaginella moellendorffii]
MALLAARLRRRPLLTSASIVAGLVAYESFDGAAPALGIFRSTRAVYTFALNSVDYKFSLRDHDKKTEEYYEVLSQVHLRAAKRILRLCEANRGFYTKAGQFIASLGQFPKEYVETLRVLQDQAQAWPYRAIKQVFLEEFGRTPGDMFHEFDEKPLAAASLAQVHHAWLSENEEVAVKVQYPGLQRQFEIDISTMAFLSKCVAWLFPDYQFEWLVPEFEKNLLSELDFAREARSAERATANFANKKEVKIPSVFWDYTTNRVLTMQFMHGSKVDDVESMEKAGIDSKQVSRVLLEIFAEMIFCHGVVHGDPHPGNILVSHNPARGSKHNFHIVILDHGLYRELDENFRRNFCNLWKAMITSDPAEMEKSGLQLGAGEYSRFLPVILTGRTLDSKSGLGKGMSPEERTRLRDEVRKFSMGDISYFMEGLSRDFLIVLRTDGLLRSIVHKLGAPRRLRLETYARYALLGRAMHKRGKPGFREQGIVLYSRSLVEYAYLRFRLVVLEYFLKADTLYSLILGYLNRFLPMSKVPT